VGKELAFHVEQDGEVLVAIGDEPEIATQGENLEGLIAMVRDLVRCRFDDGDERLGWPVRFHFCTIQCWQRKSRETVARSFRTRRVPALRTVWVSSSFARLVPLAAMPKGRSILAHAGTGRSSRRPVPLRERV